MERGDGRVWWRESQPEEWKVRLRSEKGRQLVSCVSLTVVSGKAGIMKER